MLAAWLNLSPYWEGFISGVIAIYGLSFAIIGLLLIPCRRGGEADAG